MWIKMWVWVKVCLVISAALFFLGCAAQVDMKMDPQEKYLLESDRMPGEM